MHYEFSEDTFESKVLRVNDLIAEEKELKKQLKLKESELDDKTIDFIRSISDKDAKTALEAKWIHPLIDEIFTAPLAAINVFVNSVEALSNKYIATANDIENQIRVAEDSLCKLLGELVADEYDNIGLIGLKKLLGGE